MRPSKREAILHAAKTVVQREGVTALSYDSVAAESGLTKGGLLYHFPSREELLQALHEYVAGQWEQAMEEEAGAPAEQLSPQQRFAAYARLSQNPDRAELLLQLEAGADPRANAVWERIYRLWAPPTPQLDDEAGLMRFVAKLAADGLWFHEALASQPLDPQLRQRAVEAVIALAERRADQ